MKRNTQSLYNSDRSSVALIDVDDVLANTREFMVQVLSEVYGIESDWQAWGSYDLQEVAGIPFCPQTFSDQEMIQRVQPEPGAGAFLRALKTAGLHVVITTARGWHPHGAELTHQWLQQHGLEYDRLIVTDLSQNKRMVAEQFSRVALCVDDHPHHIEGYLSCSHIDEVVMVRRPWNRHLDTPDSRATTIATLQDYHHPRAQDGRNDELRKSHVDRDAHQNRDCGSDPQCRGF